MKVMLTVKVKSESTISNIRSIFYTAQVDVRKQPLHYPPENYTSFLFVPK